MHSSRHRYRRFAFAVVNEPQMNADLKPQEREKGVPLIHGCRADCQLVHVFCQRRSAVRGCPSRRQFGDRNSPVAMQQSDRLTFTNRDAKVRIQKKCHAVFLGIRYWVLDIEHTSGDGNMMVRTIKGGQHSHTRPKPLQQTRIGVLSSFSSSHGVAVCH
jgi:hypothetical protein